ncbi:MAG: hypothetical protein AAGJ73_13960 [Pseudomonadota bacterium]
MNLYRQIAGFLPPIALVVALSVMFFTGAAAPAAAATATYSQPDFISATDLTALSTAGDNAGVSLTFGETLALNFDQPFATSRGGNVSIFTVAPASGVSWLFVRIGSFNNGSPLFSRAQGFIRAGTSRSFNNLFQRGCRAFGGCDYIEITNIFSAGNPSGAEVDYVEVDDEVTNVTAPTPEPSTWAMMIVGFWFAAWRLKAARRPHYFRRDRADLRYA